MIELGPGADLFRLVGGLFWLVTLFALLAALLWPESAKGKGIAVVVVIGLFAAFPGRWAWERQQAIHAFKAQRARALPHFEERCKGAGEFIYRTADGVEGLFVGEIPTYKPADLKNPNAQNIYNRDLWGDGYIQSFLMGRNAEGVGIWAGHIDPANPVRDEQGRLVPDVIMKPGYRWIEATDPSDGRRYRYTGEFELLHGSNTSVDLKIRRHPPEDPPPRYSVERIDISTPEDRDLWVAGGLLRVKDLQTGEILAERIGFMVDRAQGSTAGAREPWLYAVQQACPPFPLDRKIQGGAAVPMYQTRLFVERVLKIKGYE